TIVGVPNNGHAPIFGRRQGRLPTTALLRADSRFLGPIGLGLLMPRENVKSPFTRALPRHPHAPLAVGGRHGADIAARVGRESLRISQLAVLVTARPNIEIV